MWGFSGGRGGGRRFRGGRGGEGLGPVGGANAQKVKRLTKNPEKRKPREKCKQRESTKPKSKKTQYFRIVCRVPRDYFYNYELVYSFIYL